MKAKPKCHQIRIRVHLILRPIKPASRGQVRRGAPRVQSKHRMAKPPTAARLEHEFQDGRVRLCKNYKTAVCRRDIFPPSHLCPAPRLLEVIYPVVLLVRHSLGRFRVGFAVLQFALPPFCGREEVIFRVEGQGLDGSGAEVLEGFHIMWKRRVGGLVEGDEGGWAGHAFHMFVD